MLRTPAAQRAPPVERLMAEGYAWRRAGNPAAALKAYGEAMQAVARQPGRAQRGGRRAARHGRALRRRDDRRHRRGRSRRNRPPPWCVGARRSGRPTRRAASTAPMPRSRGSMRCWPAAAAGRKALRRRLRLDRMVALRDRVRMQEAVEEGEALSADGPLPAICRAGLRRCAALSAPARGGARCLQARAGADSQGRPGALRQFLRLRRARGFHGGLRHDRSLVGDEPIWRSYSDDPTPLRQSASAAMPSRRRRRRASTATSSARRGTAWCACPTPRPPTPTRRLALYQVANARGWPRRAQAEAEIAASLAPRDVGSRRSP